MIKLKRNMSNFDRVARFIVALFLLSLFFVANFKGILGLLIIIPSCMFLFASITSFCPFYKSTNLSTYKISEELLNEESNNH